MQVFWARFDLQYLLFLWRWWLCLAIHFWSFVLEAHAGNVNLQVGSTNYFLWHWTKISSGINWSLFGQWRFLLVKTWNRRKMEELNTSLCLFGSGPFRQLHKALWDVCAAALPSGALIEWKSAILCGREMCRDWAFPQVPDRNYWQGEGWLLTPCLIITWW